MAEERNYTPFDGKENDWLSFARQQSEFYRNAGQYITNLQIDIKEIDTEIENILLEIEDANCNVAQGYKVFKRLKELRLASGIAALVVSICLSVCRLSSNTDVVTDAVAGGSVVGLRMTMTVIPVIGLLIAVFYFHRKYILTEQKMEEISERIKESH